MITSIENQDFGHYALTISQCNREDFIEMANLLRDAESTFLRQIGLEMESELMEVL